jgi:hypothetical protein
MSLTGLITLALLALFSLLYLSSSIPNKPPFIVKTLAWMQKNLNHLALAGVIFGFLAACLTPLRVYRAADMILGMLANITLVMMALPYMFDRFKAKHGAKMNRAIMEELTSLVGWIQQKAFLLGCVGAVMAAIEFILTFRM